MEADRQKDEGLRCVARVTHAQARERRKGGEVGPCRRKRGCCRPQLP